MVFLLKSLTSVKRYNNPLTSKLFIKFFISYMIMFILPIIFISLLVYDKFFSTLEREIKDYSMATLNQAREMMDIRLKELDELAFQLSINRNVVKFMLHEMENGPEKVWAMKEIVQDLSIYRVPNTIIDTTGLYFFKNDMILSQQSNYETEYFYQNFSKYEKMDYATWLQKINHLNNRELWPVTTIANESKAPRNVITYLNPIPRDSYDKFAVFIALIDEESVWSLLAKSELASRSFLGIADGNGNLITTAGRSENGISFDFIDLLDGDEGYSLQTYEGRKYAVMHTSSKVTDWKFFFITPEEVLMDKISYIRIILISVVAASIVLGLILSYLMSSRHYTPIRNIIRFIKSNRAKPEDDHGEEYETILSTIRDVFVENRKLEHKYQKQIPAVKNHFIVCLLKQHMIDENKHKEFLELCELDFPHPYYVVAIIKIDDFGNFGIREGKTTARFAVSRAAEECMGSRYPVHAVDLEEDKLALLINVDRPDVGTEGAGLTEAIAQLQNSLNHSLELMVSIGVGKSSADLLSIYKSYNEAVTALNYSLIVGVNLISYYEQVQDRVNTIYYPLEKEQQLINYVKIGEYGGIERILDELYRLNFIERKLSLPMVNCLMYSLTRTTLNILEELHVDHAKFVLEELEMLQNDPDQEQADRKFERIKRIYETTCHIVSRRKSSGNTALIHKILGYLHAEYARSTLSLVEVADRFGVSATYLSKFFKEQTGYNFAHYVNRCRLNHGKELLRNRELSIQEIAGQIGFMSANTFIRVFKKYESVTPGQYRDSISSMEDAT